ncbi:MAG: outer membrane protein assembly factor BamD [Candidatus Binatia bacterium]
MYVILLLLAAVALAVSGCGPGKPLTPDEYFNTAAEHLRVGSYSSAVETYQSMLDEHPFSEHSEEAELNIGIAQYKNLDCPEATATFTDFQRRHPTSPHLPLVGYLLAQCAEQQMDTVDRDQSASQNAHAYYQAVIQQFPESPYAHLARERLEYCRETLASHELNVALYYDQHGNEKAAEYRLIDLLNRFEDTDVGGTALVRLGNIYERGGDSHKAILAYSAVIYHYPEHEAAQESSQRLEALLVDDATAPTGDPLAALRNETGRTRNLAIAQVPSRPPTASTQSKKPTGGGLGGLGGGGSGIGLPGRSPFGGPGRGGFGGGRY